jgi:hypothetical protein
MSQEKFGNVGHAPKLMAYSFGLPSDPENGTDK